MTMHGALAIVCDNGGKLFVVTGEIFCRVSTKLYAKLFLCSKMTEYGALANSIANLVSNSRGPYPRILGFFVEKC